MHPLTFKYKNTVFYVLTLCAFALIFPNSPLITKGLAANNNSDINLTGEPRDLYDEATKLFYKEQQDSAYKYYKAAAIGASKRGSAQNDSVLAAKAYNMCGVIDYYNGRFLDAYRHYMKAIETGGERRFYWVWISAAGILNIYTAYNDAETLLMRSYEMAKKDKEWSYLMNAYAALVGQRMINDNTADLKQIINDFNTLPLPKDGKGPEVFLLKVTEGMQRYVKADYEGAIQQFRQAQRLKEYMWTPLSGDLGCQVYIAKTFMAAQKPDSALNCLTAIEKSAFENKFYDICLDVYLLMSKCSLAKGDTTMADKYRLRHYELRDSLLSLADYAQMKAIDYQHEIENYEKTILKAQLENAHHRKMLVATLAGLVIFIILFLIILIQNRKLSTNNKLLFIKNKEALTTKPPTAAPRPNKPATPTDNTELSDNNVPDMQDDKSDVSESTLRITDDEKMRIRNRIDDFFAESDEWFSPDFSMERLVQYVGSNKLYVSYVINSEMNTNYHELLNSYRIKEVCRRLLDTPQYGNMTVESISQEVGYKSRSNFIKNFKKQTGLTPKTWQALAHKNSL